MFRSLTLTTKIILGGIVLALASTAIMGGINQLRVIPALTEMGETFLGTVSADVLSAVKMQNAITQEKVNSDLELLFIELARHGEVEEDQTRPVPMEIVNQATGAREKVNLPKLTAGYQDLTGNFEIVDQMQKMVGGTATIFQVLPGKMVRVSTNVRRPDGERAVGTYIDDQSPVYQACLRGETYRGRALVVGDWYVTAYKPIKDASGKVMAVVYVGRPILSMQLRTALEATRVAGKGFAFVYTSAGDILQSNDSDLRGKNLKDYPFGQALLEQKNGVVDYVAGQTPKKTLVRYFEPWDWYVAVGIDAADLDHGMGARLTQAAFLGAGAAVAAGIVLALLASGYVTRPLRRAEEAARRIASGDHSLRLAEGRDEVGRLSRAFNAILDANDEAARVNANYVNMLNAVDDPIFAVDGDMRIIAANARAALLAGKPQAELAGLACRDAFPAALCDAARCASGDDSACAGDDGRGSESGVVEIGLSGAARFVKPVSGLMRDASGQTLGYVEVARDVTDMVRAERAMAENLERTRQVGEEINTVGLSIAKALEGISGQVDEVRQGSERQSRRVGETATAMSQMNAAVLEVAKNASEAAHNATSARAKAEEGAQAVQRAVASIAAVEKRILSLEGKMATLGEKAQGIGRIIGVISDIADQTNLLALNAAIEAARAGDAGRGFAVVADEVRKLAEKTMTATQEVETAVADIQRGATENMEATRDAAREITESTRMAERSGRFLTDIVDLVTATADQVRSIAASAEEQSAASEHVSAAMEEVSRISAETAEGMAESADAVGDLTELAGRLRALAE
jgi:methyl-accepting chemotaxis protein